MAKRILRPLSYTELFDEVFDLYKRHFLLLYGVCAVPSILATYVTFATLKKTSTLWSMLLPTPGFILSTLGTFVAVWAISQCYLGRPASVMGSYLVVFRRPVAVIVTSIMAVIMFDIGLLCCGVPAIIALFWCYFLAPVVVVENTQYISAIKRSRELAKGQWGRIFIVSIMSAVLCTIISYICRLPGQLIIAGSYGFMYTPSSTIEILNSAITGSISAPIMSLPIVLLYYDIRVRKEGFDIEMLARDLGTTPEEVKT